MLRITIVLSVFLLALAPVGADETQVPKPAPVEKPASGEKPAPETAEEQAPVPTLREAVRDGQVQAEGSRPSGYRKVFLKLRNKTKKPLSIDLCGSHLVPRRSGSCQRLGLGPAVTPKKGRKPRQTDFGTVVVDLGPGETHEIQMNTCCLDAGKPSPSTQQFTVARSKLPPVRESVLRWWADHPHAPQSAVNSAIWQNRATVHWDASGKSQARIRSSASGIVGHAGIHYLLKKGELLSRDGDGIVRFLGTDILDVFPTDSAIYAEALGDRAGTTMDRPRELWRLVATGEEPWSLVASLPEEITIRELHVAPNGMVLLEANQGLYRVDPQEKRTTKLVSTPENDSLSIRFEKKGTKLLYAVKKRSKEPYYQGGERKGGTMAVCELHRLDYASATSEHIRTFWNVKSIRMGAGGIFALTPGGKLRRLQGRSFKNIGGARTYDQILRVGRKTVWMEVDKGKVVSLGLGGSPRFERPRSIPNQARLDRRTDDLYFMGRGTYYRVEPKKGKRYEIPAAGD